MSEPSTTFQPPTETSLNYSDTNNGNECSRDNFTEISINSVILLICLFELVGNGIVLWFVSFHIKRNLFTVYILNLGVADFGFLLFLAISLTIDTMNNFFCFSFEWRPFLLLFPFAYNSSLYLLTAASIERCLSVLFPIWRQCHRAKHCVFLASLLIGLLHCFSPLNTTEKCPMKVITMHVLNFLIFTPIIVLSNLILSIKVRCSSQKRQPRKLYAVILLTVLFFLAFTVPLCVQSFVRHFNYSFLPSWICLMLASVSSCINPVIYFLVGSYRKRRFGVGSVKVVLQRVFEEKADTRKAGETHRIDPLEMAT
ncbi:LOW QUALITY PROTEIN: mas-related G-protein coupled receptor member H-like [Natator depressus]|uniref:LOW QUALITY PROTEIN: mas-related G-protein coupled receptor member H-like n=1 Tax=Natator depressus TaxID=27790 RepID=UPI003EBB3882